MLVLFSHLVAVFPHCEEVEGIKELDMASEGGHNKTNVLHVTNLRDRG